jgi:hypothetical protein
LAITLCRRGRAVELQEEMLLLLDALVGARTDVLHKGPAGIECVGGRGTQGLALGRLEVGARLQRAAHAGRQVLGELEGPLPVADPAAIAGGGLGIAAAQAEGCGGLRISEVDRRSIELRHHLAHLRHLALRRQAGDGERLRAECRAEHAGGRKDAAQIHASPGSRCFAEGSKCGRCVAKKNGTRRCRFLACGSKAA